MNKVHIEQLNSQKKGVPGKLYTDENNNRYIGLESGRIKRLFTDTSSIQKQIDTSISNNPGGIISETDPVFSAWLAVPPNLSEFNDDIGFLTSSNIEDAINDGVIDKAPTENAVYDALGTKEDSLGFTPEDVSNKVTDFSTINNTLYPSVEAVDNRISATAGISPPTSFSFTNQTNVSVSTLISSNTITLDGDPDSVWTFSLRGNSGAQMKITTSDGISGSWGTDGIARKDDTIQLRITSSGSLSTSTTCTLRCNGFSTTWSVTTTSFIFILDTYGSNCAAAYSVRQLRSAYAGSCMKVRRSSDNTEQDIGFSSNVLDTASLLSFVGAGSGYVSKWYDQSGNSHDFVNATTGTQPRIVNSGSLDTDSTTGKPAIYSADAARMLAASFTLNQPVDLFFVWRFKSYIGPTEDRIMDGNGGTAQFRADSSSTVQIYAGNFLTTSYPVTANTTYLTSVLYNGGSSNTYKNGSSYATGNAGANNLSGITLFNGSGSSSIGGNCYFSELIAYTADKATDLSAINSNINAFYAIY